MARVLFTCLAILGLLFGGITATAQEKSPAAKTEKAIPLVNLNTATAAQIVELPGIGPATAQRIIEHREKTGGFKKIEELMNVKGIGEKSFLKLKPYLTVTDPKAAK